MPIQLWYTFKTLLQARLTEVEGENECLKVAAKQKEQEVRELQKVGTWSLAFMECFNHLKFQSELFNYVHLYEKPT